MPRKQQYQPPTPGQWHDNLEVVEPAARPRRPAQPVAAEGRAQRRKRAVARRSHERVSPTGDYYFWCDHCDYCNLPTEGQRARCPRHATAHEANRKKTNPAPTGINDAVLRRAHQAAREVIAAREDARRAQRFPREHPNASANLDAAILRLLNAVSALPRPANRTRQSKR